MYRCVCIGLKIDFSTYETLLVAFEIYLFVQDFGFAVKLLAVFLDLQCALHMYERTLTYVHTMFTLYYIRAYVSAKKW